MPNGSGVPTSLRRRVFREDGLKCASCGIVGFEKRFPRGGYGYYTHTEGVYLSIDHIVPKAKGGTNDRSNLRVLCTTCNTRKGIKDA
ncbi:HNH endonuclease [Pusillimonas sp. 7-48]|uniref:HNH endonuclease n=2 Tax=Pusillimonas minor TaxID=2697024 RepID=A0A842HJW2_9BURK|nr:HNH endonuclease [Pusillimonas minor]